MLLPVILYFLIFNYWPMYGVLIAFKDYMPFKGFNGSPWIGFEMFDRFLTSYLFWDLVKNTISLSLYSLIVGFPIPIILSLFLNQIKSEKFKKWVQTITFAPNFLSVIVVVGMLFIFLSPETGMINKLMQFFGVNPIFFMARPEWYQSIYVWSGVWQSAGFSMIIYLAALSGIDPSLHEAAIVDGANKWKRILYIDIPSIMPTIIVLLILSIGSVMAVGFEKAYLMQNSLNLNSSEIIATYVYKVGLLNNEYSYSAAIGLFNSVINCGLLILVNLIAKKTSNTSLW